MTLTGHNLQPAEATRVDRLPGHGGRQQPAL